MRKKNCLLNSVSIFLLCFAALIYTKPAQALTSGGLSRVRIENTIIDITGGICRSIENNTISIWLTEPAAQIRTYPWKKTTAKTTQIINFNIANIHPANTKLEGIDKFQTDAKEIHFQLKAVSQESKLIKLTTQWDQLSYQFVVMGDNRDNPKLFKKILKEINRHKPMFVINCGDLVPLGKKEEYQEFSEIIQVLKSPIFFAIGNHDVIGKGWKFYNDLFGPTYYSFCFLDTNFIIVDNARNRIDNTQYRWLAETLSDNANSRNFIFMHLPPFDPRPKKNHAMELPLNAQWFLDLVDTYKVHTVFAAHIHSYWKTQRGNINYIITGGAGAPLRSKKSFYHYLLVTVTPTEVKTQVIKLE